MNFGLLAAQIVSLVWGTPANVKIVNGYRVLAALLNGTVIVGVSKTLRRCTEGATYIRQGGHHIGHWLTLWLLFYYGIFLYNSVSFSLLTSVLQSFITTAELQSCSNVQSLSATYLKLFGY